MLPSTCTSKKKRPPRRIARKIFENLAISICLENAKTSRLHVKNLPEPAVPASCRDGMRPSACRGNRSPKQAEGRDVNFSFVFNDLF
jgi:hypothetical protein